MTDAVGGRLEVIDQVARSPVHVGALGISTSAKERFAVRHGEFVRQGCLQAGGHECVRARRGEHKAGRQRIVREIEPRGEIAALPGRPGIGEVDVGRIADQTVRADLCLVVPAGVLAVREMRDVIAVALKIGEGLQLLRR